MYQEQTVVSLLRSKVQYASNRSTLEKCYANNTWIVFFDLMKIVLNATLIKRLDCNELTVLYFVTSIIELVILFKSFKYERVFINRYCTCFPVLIDARLTPFSCGALCESKIESSSKIF